jgi:CubicO group peptidase (beta-lactamase class C family)
MYDLLGLIVERLSGVDFKGFLEKEILQPIGLTQSTLHLSEASESGDIAVGYWRSGETNECKGRNLRVESGMDEGEGLVASAGLWSTAEDMVSQTRDSIIQQP